jgi:hypothetical protein
LFVAATKMVCMVPHRRRDNDCHVWAAPKKSRSRRRHNRQHRQSHEQPHVYSSICRESKGQERRRTRNSIYNLATAAAAEMLGLIARRDTESMFFWRRRVSCYEVVKSVTHGYVLVVRFVASPSGGRSVAASFHLFLVL